MAGQTFSASAPGKVILFGEHAVVYGYPAVAAPVMNLEATARVEDLSAEKPAGFIQIDAPDVGLQSELRNLPLDHPLSLAVRGVLVFMNITDPPAFKITITSTIPVAGGLGSGAAVSVAIIRAVAGFFRTCIRDEMVSGLSYEVEKRHHGRPSGIDNTVITYEKPIYFQREKPFEVIQPGSPLHLVIADTGIASPTAAAVAGVRERHDRQPEIYTNLFEQIGAVSIDARKAIIDGSLEAIGILFDRNHAFLRQIGVSCEALDHLADAAREAGALGAKLSGGGLGGNLIALVNDPGDFNRMSSALIAAGAVRCFHTTIPAGKGRLSW